GTALEVEAGGVAVVVRQGTFQPEGSGHAATQVFRATEAQARAVVAGVRDAEAHVARAGQNGAAGALAPLQRGVNDTEQGDRRLGGSRTSGSHHGQRNQGLFHASFSKVKHGAPVRMDTRVQARSDNHRIPGPTSFWEVVRYSTRPPFVSQR